jgi:SagB-type dehydrogenase family enzyme
VSSQPLDLVHKYHDGTKHHFDRFAPSLGYLDWASQPRPFRSFAGAPAFDFSSATRVSGLRKIAYDRLYDPSGLEPLPVTAATIGHFLRHSLGLSAWKAFRGARWSLRVNPSSGNLHPTEAYLLVGPLGDFAETPGVWHYAPDRHAIERRCAFDRSAWTAAEAGEPTDSFFVALTSIHWRESWKYGERAFRYCQHDLGHAIAALSLSAAVCGWRLAIDPAWDRGAIAAVAGVDRDDDYSEAEREEPACMMRVTRSATESPSGGVAGLIDAVREGRWFGRASQLSENHVQWTFIDQVARATEDPGHTPDVRLKPDTTDVWLEPDTTDVRLKPDTTYELNRGEAPDAAKIILQRRSALAFDGASIIGQGSFLRMLERTMPAPGAPWRATWWSPRIHLALFVHRVEGIAPGLYLLLRSSAAITRLRAAFNPNFVWALAGGRLPLFLLEPGDYRRRSQRVSCDQNIASDGFFSLGMIADFEAGLDANGPSFYRHLFWETGVVGPVLYLEAEAAGARATGIGCFYDDPVHQLLGIDETSGHSFQSLYHFTVGMPVEDTRLTSEPGYPWEI